MQKPARAQTNRTDKSAWPLLSPPAVALYCVMALGVLWLIAVNTPAQQSTTTYGELNEAAEHDHTPTESIATNSITPVISDTQQEQNRFLDSSFLDQLHSPYGFSIEPFNHQLIWTGSEEMTFKVATRDGGNIRSIITNFEHPYFVKVDHSFGHLIFFYADGKLHRRNVDTQLGSDTDTILIDLGQQVIHGLGFDELNNLLFW